MYHNLRGSSLAFAGNSLILKRRDVRMVVRLCGCAADERARISDQRVSATSICALPTPIPVEFASSLQQSDPVIHIANLTRRFGAETAPNSGGLRIAAGAAAHPR